MRRPSSNSCNASPMYRARTSRNSCSGTLRPARPRLPALPARFAVANPAAMGGTGAARQDPGLLAARGAVLADGPLEPAFVALALTLPGEADIAREIARDVDPDAVFAARRGLQAAVGEHLAEPLLDHYRRLSESGPYDPDAVSARPPTLPPTCLELLAATP